MKRKILSIVFVALLMLSGSAGYLLLSENGLKWLLSATEDLFPGKLSASSFSGRIIGPVVIEDLRYHSDDFDLSVKRVFFDWRPLSLLFLRFHISALHADNAELRLSDEKKETAAKEETPFKLPMAVIVDDASVSDLRIRQPGSASLFIIKKANLAARASGESVRIDTFGVSASMFDLDINGAVTLQEDYPLDVKTRWTVRPEGYPDIAGKGSIDGSLKKLTVLQDASGLFQASLQATVLNVLRDMEWTAVLDIESLRPAHIMDSLPDVGLSGQIRGEGDLDGLSFRLVHAKMLGGQLDGEGNVKWSMGPGWEISMRGRGLDPGEVWPDFPGKLDLSVNAVGKGRQQGGQVVLDLQGLKGQVRGYKVSASGTFLMSGDEYSVRRLEARSGSAYLNAKGTLSGEADFQWDFKAPDLGEIFPEASGNVKGRGTITGPRDAPRVKASLSGGRVEVSGYRAGRLSADIDVELTETGNVYLDLGAKNLLIASMNLTALNVKGEGTAASHRIRIDAGSDKVSVEMTVHGGLKKKTWSGMLAESRIASDMAGTWTLKKPGSLLISGDRIAGGSLCFVDGGAEACMEGEWKKDSDSHGKIMLAGLPLTLVSAFLPSELKPRGTVSGSADIYYSAERTIRGNIELVLSAGNIAYVTKGKEIVFAYGPGTLIAALNQETLEANLALPVQEGSIKGKATLPRFNPLSFDAKSQDLAGNIHIERIRLNFLPVFFPDIQEADGTVSADIAAAGTLASPQLTGSITVSKGAASVAPLGISLTDITFSATSDGTEHFIFQGSASSGGGTLHIEGRTFMDPQSGWPSEMRVTGEKFEFVNIPPARIIAAPDITVHTRKGRAEVKGAVRIPEARLEPRDLSGAVRPSPDVVVVSSRDGAAAKEELKIYSSIKFSFGEKVFFSGFGLKGFISGDLTVVDDPVGLTLASGELRIRDGEYSAYGQTLKIEQGRLLFAGSPVDNPGLDIRVVRRVGEVKAGIEVQGTLDSPELKLFSTPSMSQEDILSYLLIGRPLSGATGAEGNFLYNAALKAGLKGGGFIASRIGARFGLDELTVETGAAAEESSLVLGKYLSPRLYVSYGIGLFQPTYVFRVLYELSNRWSLQSEHGPESGADLFYKIEK